jgi:hypothetical protein
VPPLELLLIEVDYKECIDRVRDGVRDGMTCGVCDGVICGVRGPEIVGI